MSGDTAIKPIFSINSAPGLKLLALSLIALALIVGGSRLPGAEKLRSELSVLAVPFYWITDYPSELLDGARDALRSRSELEMENERLRSQAVILEAKVQKLASLRAENNRLRELLNASAHLAESVLVAEVTGVAADASRHEFVINLGREHELFLGQAVIDAKGLLGQVIEVGRFYSRVLLISDSSHALSVQVNRNGVRAVLEGTGRLDTLAVMHVPATTDIQVGDLLVSSGLGGRFPVGYPVARVSSVSVDPGKAFAEVQARPMAALDRSQHVLLVFGEQAVLPGLLSNGEG